MRPGKSRVTSYLALLCAVLPLSGQGGAAAAEPHARPPLLIVGQDLDSIRGYYDSGCCPPPDGTTAYVSLYELLSDEHNYGGLGIDVEGRPVDSERGWGAGPVSAWKTAHEFPVGHLAIGLWIAENDHPHGLARIASGEFDAEIGQLARFLQRIDGRVYLRIGYEFDGGWNAGFENVPRFIAAWRHIVDRLRAAGVANTETVWQASTSMIDELRDRRHEDIRDWYPGDEYVDWMGLSWFRHPDERNAVASAYRPLTMGELAGELLAFARARGKLVMIAESTPQGFDLQENTRANISRIYDGPTGEDLRTVSDGEIWEYWFAPLFAFMHDNADVVRALAYINCDWESQPMWGPPYAPDEGYWGDTRIETNAEIAARFTAAVERWKASGGKRP